MNKNQNNNYDLEKITAFSEDLIELCKKALQTVIVNPIISQLIRSGTSVGANYCEANGDSSKKDFANKIFICKKEGKETMYWLHLLAKAALELTEGCRKLWKEAHELTLIFSKLQIIVNSFKIKKLIVVSNKKLTF